MKKLVLVDTLNILFRSYYAMRNLKGNNEKPIGMIFGLLNFLAKLKDEIECDYVVFALDCSGGSFRKELLEDYKANRKELEPELKDQIPVCLDIIKKAGFLSIEIQGYEADDIIASVAKKAQNEDILTHVYSTDKDLYQLISENVKMVGKDYEEIGEEGCIEKFGVKPSQMVDYLALVGDSADNFKGVPGIGPVAARKLLSEYKNIDDIYSNLNVLGNKSSQKKLLENKDLAYLSLKLAKLVDDIDLGDFIKNANKPSDNFFSNLMPILEEYGLYKFIKLAKNTEIKEEKPKQISLKYSKKLIENEEELKQILANIEGEVGFDIETTGLNVDDKVVGFSFAYLDKSFYVPIRHKDSKNIDENTAVNAIKELFKREIIGHNLKFDFKMLKANYGIDFPKSYKDSMLAAWLLNPSSKYSLDYTAKVFLNHTCISYEELVSKDKNFSDLKSDEAYLYACEDAYITKALFYTIYEKLDDDTKRAYKHENEFIKTLVELENNGILVNKKKLENLKESLENELKELEKKVFSISGEEFNLNSPKQLKEILYNKLALPDNNKGSTNEETLLKLDHPISSVILEYRTASKVYSTYVLPLLELNTNNEDEFIVRSHFMQTGTATGRLSSNKPNLQNIPARSKYASLLKEAFIAKDGYSLISLDYSQIELRMLAHFSKDPSLLKAFLNDEDIHTRTAITIFNEVDKIKRNFAKSINFGLIYGMGARRLSEELKIPYNEASEYIKKYFDSFPSIKDYFDFTKKQTKEIGYIKTLLGRKRYFKYGSNARENSANDRECINSILQGSAADLIKLAMIRVYQYLNDNAKMILQIHDELIFEVKDEYIDDFSKLARNIMENAYPLSVKIKTSLSVGKNWSEIK